MRYSANIGLSLTMTLDVPFKLLGVRIGGILGDIDPFNKVPFQRVSLMLPRSYSIIFSLLLLLVLVLLFLFLFMSELQITEDAVLGKVPYSLALRRAAIWQNGSQRQNVLPLRSRYICIYIYVYTYIHVSLLIVIRM